MVIKHHFVSAKPEGADATKVRAQSGWNYRHDIEPGTRSNKFNIRSYTDIAAALYTFAVGGKDILNLRSDSKQIPNSGLTNVADGGTIAHNAGFTPNRVWVMATVAGEFASVLPANVDATNFQVDIKKNDGTGGTTQNVYWKVEYVP